MDRDPVGQADRELIARLQSQLDDLRLRLKIGDRGEVLFRADLSYGDDEIIIVEADGFGGAVLRVIEGNYPVDYITREERGFSSEEDAEAAAETLWGEPDE